MLHRTLRLFALIGCLALAPSAFPIAVRMNTDSAKAVLEAMQNPALSHDEALKIARMRGNQGIIRKLNEFKIPATAESFADALYAAAHGEQVTDSTEKSFYFDTVKPKVPQLLELIKQIETNPQAFQTSIEQRIALFTPPNANIHLDGYIVAGGDGGGYAFGRIQKRACCAPGWCRSRVGSHGLGDVFAQPPASQVPGGTARVA